MKGEVKDKTFLDRRLNPRKPIMYQSAASMPAKEFPRIETGFQDVDRFFGGGLVLGAKTLLGGMTGTGKSTLATQIAMCLAKRKKNSLWMAGEESPFVCRARAERLGASRDMLRNFFFTESVVIEDIIELIYKYEPSLVVFDSLQKVRSKASKAEPGTKTQLARIMEALKLVPDEVAYLFLGQTTKQGKFAGSQSALHDFDQLCWLGTNDVEPTQVNLSWAGKNRMGSCNTESLLFMTPRGFMTYDKMQEEIGQVEDLENPFIKEV